MLGSPSRCTRAKFDPKPNLTRPEEEEEGMLGRGGGIESTREVFFYNKLRYHFIVSMQEYEMKYQSSANRLCS